MRTAASTAIALVGAYICISWFAFQWRNPIANEASFFRDFPEVLKWERMPKYQIAQ